MKQLYLLGDSISISYGPFLETCLKNFFELSRKGGSPKDAVGHEDDPNYNGRDSQSVLLFLETTPPKTDLLLLNCGLHDIKVAPGQASCQVPLDRYRNNLHKIVSITNNLPCTTFWVNTTPVNDRLHNRRTDGGAYRYNKDVLSYNESAAQIMGQARIPVIDLYSYTLALGETSYRDHIHFTPSASHRQAIFLAEAILRIDKI